MAVSISASVFPVGLMTLATAPSMAKVAGHRPAQVPQPIHVVSFIFGCFIIISFSSNK